MIENLIKVWSDFNCSCKMCKAVGNINDPNDDDDPFDYTEQ